MELGLHIAAIMGIDASSTAGDIVRTGTEMAKIGYTARYVYASGIAEPTTIVDLMGTAVGQLA